MPRTCLPNLEMCPGHYVQVHTLHLIMSNSFDPSENVHCRASSLEAVISSLTQWELALSLLEEMEHAEASWKGP